MEINSWFQDGYPQSYKIQLMYYHGKSTKEKYADTPFRFKTYADAAKSASEMYQNVAHRIVGSMDSPHWMTAADKLTKHQLVDKDWYHVYGIKKAPLARAQSMLK